MKKVVVITGVAGGIGRATARVFRDNNWCVVGVDRRRVEAIDEIHHFIQADIGEYEAPKNIIDEVTKKQGRLDALVNNAALQICKPLIETTPDEWDATMASNVRSVYLSVRHAYPLLKESRGSIVNISSVHAVATSCGIAAYAASKGALLALTRAIALEFGPDGIRANAVLPGAVDTPMLHAGLSRGHVQADGSLAGASSAATVDKLVRGLGKKHVMGRVGQPEEIGKTIHFLADSSQSSFMTGQALVVDGGATARLSTE